MSVYHFFVANLSKKYGSIFSMQLGNGRYYDKIISSKLTSENQNIRQSFVMIHEHNFGKKSFSILLTDLDQTFLLAADIKMTIYYIDSTFDDFG